MKKDHKKKVIKLVVDKGDSIVAISGLFANVGVFGITLGEIGLAFSGLFYGILIALAALVAYWLWNFKVIGWLTTVLFSVVCIFLALPGWLNYHAALVSMILLAYIIQPAVREKYA